MPIFAFVIKTIITMEEILELESEMKKTSVPYRDSTAFSLALDYIKRTDYNYYCKLIEIESRECGIID